MAYDEELAHRIREVVSGESGLTEKPMFGGLAFLINGNLAVSASGRGGLMVRVDPMEAEALFADSGVRRMVMGGREMNGWLRVDPPPEREEDFRAWVERGVGYAESLPPKRPR